MESKLGHRAIDEVGNKYGIWDIIGVANERQKSNQCIRYVLKCRHCGNISYANGNNLRFGKYAHTCRYYGATCNETK